MATKQLAEGFTLEELDQIMTLLLEKRSLIVNELEILELAESGKASDGPVRTTQWADLASDQEAADTLLESRAAMSLEIRDIDDALLRIRSGSFGRCDGCGLPIARMRLEAIPEARLCLECRKQEEA